jgi:hypothetical protein
VQGFCLFLGMRSGTIDSMDDRSQDAERPRSRAELWTVLALLLVFVLGTPGLFALPAEGILFKPDSYKRALAGQDIYNQMPLLLGDLLAQNSNRVIPGSGDQILSALQGAKYDTVMREIFPVPWVQAQAEGLIDQFWAYFNFHAPEFHLLVDLRPVKEHLNGPGAPRIVSTIVEGLPACNAQDLLNYTLQALKGEAKGLPLCRPPEQFVGLATQAVGFVVGGAAGLMPDQLDLASGLSVARVLAGSRLEQAWGRGFAIYRVFRKVDSYLPWLALACVGLVVWAAWRTERGPVFWSGAALILPGLVAFFIALVLGAWLGQMIPFIAGQVLGNHIAILNALVTALQQVSKRFTTVVMISALAVVIIGMLMVGWSIYRREQLSAAGSGDSTRMSPEDE